ncbi:hypothetical protein [Actinophytocola sp.]|uniref:hypothetical protein n=1 Tax=Actinophytocola sp. TaxID=1872138 RepID=UPI002ED34C65
MRIFWGAAALILLVAGCAPAPVPGRGDGVVLLVDWRGGLVPSYEVIDPPDFVLYGNGQAIVREDRDTDVLRLVEYRLTPERVQTLFEEAEDAGLFDDEDYSFDEQVPDGGTLMIVLRTEEREHVVEIPVPGLADSGARDDATEFAKSLTPSNWAASDFSRRSSPYRPGRVAVTYQVREPTATPSKYDTVPRRWPLAEPEPIHDGCVVLTGETATRAQEIGESRSRSTLWQHDGVEFHAWIRPLLPDEADCDEIEQRYFE